MDFGSKTTALNFVANNIHCTESFVVSNSNFYVARKDDNEA